MKTVIIIILGVILFGSFSAKANEFKGRAYEIFIPEDRDGQIPAVFVVHGATSNSSKIRQYSKFDNWASKYGVAAIYPNGINNWNDGRDAPDVSSADIDDVLYLKELANYLSAKGLIDINEVYFIGISNGGGMSIRMACQAPELVKGIAVVATKHVIGLDCSQYKPVPAVFFLGTEDRISPHSGRPTGTEGMGRKNKGKALSAKETIKLWRGQNGCSEKHREVFIDNYDKDETSIYHYSYSNCSAPIEYFEIQGGGHTWPGATIRAKRLAKFLFGKTSQDINASEEALRLWFGKPVDFKRKVFRDWRRP